MNRILIALLVAIGLGLSTLSVVQAMVGGRWVAMQGDNMVAGTTGYRGSLVVCRANYDGGQHPGKPWDNTCNFGWGGVSHYSAKYEVLLNQNYSWATPALFSLFQRTQ